LAKGRDRKGCRRALPPLAARVPGFDHGDGDQEEGGRGPGQTAQGQVVERPRRRVAAEKESLELDQGSQIDPDP